MTESEYGKGLVVNLTKFFEHFSHRNLRDCYSVHSWIQNDMKELKPRDYGIVYYGAIESFKNVYLKVHGNPAKGLSAMIELWANGATDHLYDIQVPKAWRRLKVAKLVKELRNLGLEIGHGFTGKIWTVEDIRKLRLLTREICIYIDKRLGIENGDWGQN